MKKYFIIALGAAALVLFTSGPATAERMVIHKKSVSFCIKGVRTPARCKYAVWVPGHGGWRGRRRGYVRVPGHREYRGRRRGYVRVPGYREYRGRRGGYVRVPGYREYRGKRGGYSWILGYWIEKILE